MIMSLILTFQEEDSREKMKMYEKTIGNLMSEIGTLRNEVCEHRTEDL